MPLGQNSRTGFSISTRIAFLFCSTFSVALVTSLSISYFKMSYTLEKSHKELISSKLREADAILASGGMRGLKDFLEDEKNRILNAAYMVRILSSNGDTVYLKPSIQSKSFDFESAFKKVDNPESLIGWNSLLAINDEDRYDVVAEKIEDGYYLQIGKSNEASEEILENMFSIFAATGGIFIILSAGLGFWYARKSLSPLRHLLATIKTIEAGDLSKRVDLNSSKDELHDLGETFNRMVTRIEKLVLVMRESLDNVAHDIRTPLTKIRAIAEDALTSKQPVPVKEALQDCAENAAEVAELVDQLLSISEAEAGTLRLTLTECHIQKLLAEVVDIYEIVAQEKSISIQLNCDPNLVCILDRKRVKQAIGNLVDNAIKFSPSKSEISIIANAHSDTLKIEVKDQGIGISNADIPRIWERLYRGDKSRTTKGLGLGLSIVHSITVAHHGKVEAVQNSDCGMTFSIVLPTQGAI